MKEKAPSANQMMDKEEELLDFDLDDIPSDDLDQATANEDEEIIDLIELVEKGDGKRIKGGPAKASGEKRGADLEEEIDLQTEEISKIKNRVSKEEALQEEGILDVSDITLELSPEGEGKSRRAEVLDEGSITESDLEGLLIEDSAETARLEPKVLKSAEIRDRREEVEISEADLEGLLDEGFDEEKESDLLGEAEPQPLVLGSALEQAESAEGAEEELSELEGTLDLDGLSEKIEEKIGLDVLPDKPEVGLESVAVEKVTEKPSAPPEPAFREVAGITEQQLEAIITRVVQDVVEKAARETMANVAEKLISEAIEALKKSMETSASG